MTPESYLSRVRDLLPILRERVDETEALRRLPDETFKAFQETGLFRAVQPKRYGGYELDLETFYQAVIEMGAVCASSAWILGVVGIHNWQMALFPQQAQDEVWGEDTNIQLSTSLSPTGHIERADAHFLNDAATFYRSIDHGLRVFSGQAGGRLPRTKTKLQNLEYLVSRWTPEHLHDQPLDAELAQIQSRTREFFERLFG